jgi:NADPH-dependent 2,4-dienoyl-CoA reductase/sulfur reductase-like enzyme
MRYAIVGAGPAGVIAAETLRRTDPASSVVIVGDEPEPPYSRMAIPYFLAGGIDETGTHLRKARRHFERLKIEVRPARVLRVDPARNALWLAGGGSIPFDRLLVASGASPIKPAIEGLDLPGVHHCWTLADARAIAKLARKGAQVVLVGAGFIACIILQALVERRVKLTVVEMENRILPRMMDETGGAMIKRWCEAKGVKVLTSTKVAAVKSGRAKKDGLRVHLNRGKPLPAALVVVAAGVRSNTGFLEGSGVKVEEGVVVDRRLRTSHPAVFAAGDVAQGPDFSTGGWAVHAIQPTAADHGRVAALNMAGRHAVFQGSLNMNVLDTAGLISSSFGNWQGAGGERAEMADKDGFRYMRLEFEDDRLIGALALGRTDHIGVLRGLIQSRVRLGAWKRKLAADPQRIAEAYVACTQ